MGMTDMQYKSHLRMINALLEIAINAETPEKMREAIENLQRLVKQGIDS